MNIYDRRDIGCTGLEVVCTDFVPLIKAKREGFWTDVINDFTTSKKYWRMSSDYEQIQAFEETKSLITSSMGKPARKKVRHGT